MLGSAYGLMDGLEKLAEQWIGWLRGYGWEEVKEPWSLNDLVRLWFALLQIQRLDSQLLRKDCCYATPQNARVSCDCLWNRESFWIIQQFRNMPPDQAEKVAYIWERMSPDKPQDMMERLYEHQGLVNSLVCFPSGSGSRPCVWTWILRFRMKPLGNFIARARTVVIVMHWSHKVDGQLFEFTTVATFHCYKYFSNAI